VTEPSRRGRFLTILSTILIAAGCSVVAARQLEEEFGPTAVQNRTVPAALSAGEVDYWSQVKPILDRRCVVCHSCYDAPCQLKLESPEGLDRGASKERVYNSSRLTAAAPTRLWTDALSTEEWRTKNFFPVLNERSQNEEANREAGILFRMLNLKRNNPLPEDTKVLKEPDLSLEASLVCPRDAEMPAFEKQYPQAGMPYGFPGLSESEHSTIRSWIEGGARYHDRPELPAEVQASVSEWETFLNGASLKQQLMSRYLYEHLYLGDLYFDNGSSRHFFELVRSKTPPGQPIELIQTRRVTDAPGLGVRPYYRLREMLDTPVSKSFMPYRLGPERMRRWTKLFLETAYEVNELPDYDPAVSTNPFVTFRAIPAQVRYRFMLDEAEFFIMGFMKGPVCRGQTALNVVDDQFWVLFVDPEKDPIGQSSEFLAAQSAHLPLPAEQGSTTFALQNWFRYSENQKKYLTAKRKLLEELGAAGAKPGIDVIWDGDGNDNAALTVFRNYDSASVRKGLIGPDPKTVWVIGYPLLERIHYLLVADFDVFGNYGHQLLTRLYMDFLRIEAENNFLLLLPKSIRESEHSKWYRGIGSRNNEYALSKENFDGVETGIPFATQNPKAELLQLLRMRTERSMRVENVAQELPPSLSDLTLLHGPGISFLSETSFVRVIRADGRSEPFTILLNRAHLNVAVLYMESRRLAPDEDTLSVIRGFVGSYPNAFFEVKEELLPEFAASIRHLRNDGDYSKLVDRFGLRRTQPDFWIRSDWFQQAYRDLEPISGSLFDFSRVDNR